MFLLLDGLDDYENPISFPTLKDAVENTEVNRYLVWGLTKFRIIAILLRSKESIFYFLSIPSSEHSLKKK